jgi:hypothetical protein
MRKALVCHMLPVFEPKRSNMAKWFNKKGLASPMRQEHCATAHWLEHINFGWISTVGGN